MGSARPFYGKRYRVDKKRLAKLLAKKRARGQKADDHEPEYQNDYDLRM